MVKRLQKLYYDVRNPSALAGAHAIIAAAPNDVTRAEIKRWLHSQDAYTRHFKSRRRFTRNRVVAYAIDEHCQADLCDMQHLSRQDKGFKHLLTVVDVLSKFAWVVPIKSKTSKHSSRHSNKYLKPVDAANH